MNSFKRPPGWITSAALRLGFEISVYSHCWRFTKGQWEIAYWHTYGWWTLPRAYWNPSAQGFKMGKLRVRYIHNPAYTTSGAWQRVAQAAAQAVANSDSNSGRSVR